MIRNFLAKNEEKPCVSSVSGNSIPTINVICIRNTSTDIRFIVVGRCNTYIKKPQQPLKKAKKNNDKKTPHFRVLRLIF